MSALFPKQTDSIDNFLDVEISGHSSRFNSVKYTAVSLL